MTRCKSCRLQKCFDHNMAATQIRNLGRLVDHGNSDTHLYSSILDNVLKACKQYPAEAINYLLKGNITILELASKTFIYKPPTNATPKHIRIWSAMLDIQGIKSEDLPQLLETILYRLISRYSKDIQQKIFDRVNPTNSRIILFQQLTCKQYPAEAINYLLKGNITILELASKTFTYKPPTNATPKHIRIWSAMLDIQGI
uniref:Uncharacterized protein n=1 Tax=Panagrolaimus sp. ES5 TaxID=591445 RepID=A0AC34G7F0_9BILA